MRDTAGSFCGSPCCARQGLPAAAHCAKSAAPAGAAATLPAAANARGIDGNLHTHALTELLTPLQRHFHAGLHTTGLRLDAQARLFQASSCKERWSGHQIQVEPLVPGLLREEKV